MPLQLNLATQAFVAAFDIAGYSRRIDEPDGLTAARMDLVSAIEHTAFFGRRRSALAAHFLGDELRLAAAATDTESAEVLRFAEDVVRELADRAHQSGGASATVVSVVARGFVERRVWHRCEYLTGEPIVAVQECMGRKAGDRKILRANEIAALWERSPGRDWDVLAGGGFVKRIAPQPTAEHE